MAGGAVDGGVPGVPGRAAAGGTPPARSGVQARRSMPGESTPSSPASPGPSWSSTTEGSAQPGPSSAMAAPVTGRQAVSVTVGPPCPAAGGRPAACGLGGASAGAAA
ncbi:hypothetical protein ACFQV8_28555 [Pseudonocardia benzenivorans]